MYKKGETRTTTSAMTIPIVYNDADYVRTGTGIIKGRFSTTVGQVNTTFTNTRQTFDQSDSWNYKERIRNHQSATTRLNGTRQKLTSEPKGFASASWVAGGFISSSPFNNYSCSQKLTGWFLPIDTIGNRPRGFWSADTVSVDAEYEAKKKFFQEIRDKRTAFEGMTFIGELGETLRMLRKPLGGFRRGLDDYVDTVKKRSRNIKRRRGESRDSSLRRINSMLADTWLEKSFGWAPMINDVKNIGEVLERQIDRYESLYQRYYVQSIVDVPTGEIPLTTDLSFLAGLKAYGWSYKARCVFYTRHSVRYYGQVYTAAQRSADVVRKTMGFTANDFVPTVWELIPYSFLADYFANIGDLISMASTYTGDVAWVAKGVSVDAVAKTQLRSYSFTPPTPTWTKLRYTMLCSDMVESWRAISRVNSGIPTVNPMQDFRMKTPNAGSTKWLNISALFAKSRSVSKFLGGLV